jgi:protein-disulfide isomerase
MKNPITILMISFVFAVAGCAELQGGGTRSDIDELKAGQEAIRKELAEIKQLISPKAKPRQAGNVNHVINVSDDPYKGSKTAQLTIVEYTDYQCPYCARHAKAVLPQIQKNYVDTGKVRYVLRDFPLPFHKQAGKASEAALCAGDQGKYWEMHDVLFSNQKALGPNKLPEYAQTIGIDVEIFDTCLATSKYKGRVNSNKNDGRKAGVRGTPSFVIGYTGDDGDVKGEMLIRGAVGYADFQNAFDEMLAKKK